METVNRNIHALLNSIQKCQIYKDFKKQEEVLNKNPELAERVQRFRAENFRLQNEEGQIAPVYSISAGLDYPGVGPEHANLYKTGRAEYVPITDEEAVQALEYLSRTEGIIPAIESAHAVAAALKIAPEMKPDQIMILNISGRGDKDMQQIAEYRGVKIDD